VEAIVEIVTRMSRYSPLGNGKKSNISRYCWI